MHAGAMRMDDTMSTERELLYKVLFDMRADINDLKRMMSELLHNPCQEPVRDIKALLPTTAQSSAPVYAAGSVPVFAESEEVTDEPPREMSGSVCPVSGIRLTVTMTCSSA